MTDAQVADIKAAKEKLMQSAQKLFAKVYEQAQGAAGAQGAGPNPNPEQHEEEMKQVTAMMS